MTHSELLSNLATVVPDIAFTVSRTIDLNFRWDGDGSDPVADGFEAYDVTVTASAIANGKLIEGNAYLGGSYFKADEETGDVHGYLPQMLAEAVEELHEKMPPTAAVQAQSNAAVILLR